MELDIGADHKCIREKIRRVWAQHRSNTLGPETISIFKCHDFKEVDIDGYWFVERDQRRERLQRHPPLKPSTHPKDVEVVFPNQGLPNSELVDQDGARYYFATSDPEGSDRALFYFRRALFRRTTHKYSFDALDDAFSHLVTAELVIPSSPEEEDRIISRALSLLLTLPQTPAEFPYVSKAPDQDQDWEDHCWAKPPATNWQWKDLSFVSSYSTTVILMALAIGVTWDRGGESEIEGKESHDFRAFIDRSAELLEIIILDSQKPVKAEWAEWHAWRWFVLKSYIWASWQRCVALQYWRILQNHLIFGFDFNDLSELSLRPLSFSEAVSQRQHEMKADYMCSLAYRLLVRSRSTSLLDLRDFHIRFSKRFGRMKGRCKNEKSCNGKAMDCKRIQGAEIIDQSQHDRSCLGHETCERIVWDEVSYRDISGARAVRIFPPTDSDHGSSLRYCPASQTTAAFSHVWSHGQGGRPETGINKCLHLRYCKIAEQYDCDSYWIDATCIPSDHKLRLEAILTINNVFKNSRAVILCDSDLMSIDISSVLNPCTNLSRESIELQELLLVTTMVCDWNIRAWTLLEALRGRRRLFLLCRNGSQNALVSLRSILETISFHGSINIAILLLTQYHLFPSPKQETWLHRYTDGRTPIGAARLEQKIRRNLFSSSWEATRVSRKVEDGFVSPAEAATMLAHRFASRPGDDVVIWTLLVDNKCFDGAVELWNRYDRYTSGYQTVYTGFLVSSLPRLRGFPGLSWAPSRPTVRLDEDLQNPVYPPYDGNLSRIGIIVMNTSHQCHLRAEWGVSVIKECNSPPGTDKCYYYGKWNYEYGNPLLQIVDHFLKQRRRGILLQALQEAEAVESVTGFRDGNAGMVHIRKPLASPYRGLSSGLLFAVCGTNDAGEEAWEWLGVFEWPNDNALPSFVAREIIII